MTVDRLLTGSGKTFPPLKGRRTGFSGGMEINRGMSTERRVLRKSYEYFGGLFIQMPNYNKARAPCKSFFTIIPFFKFFSSLFLRFYREKKAKKGKKRAAAAMRGVFLLTGGGDCTII